MEFGVAFWVQLVIYALSIGAIYGSFKSRISALEKKIDRHNQVIERVFCLERDVKTAFGKLDEHREEIREMRKARHV